MADISDVNASVIKDLYQSLEGLSCRSTAYPNSQQAQLTIH